MATLLDLAMAADRPDFKELARSAAARMLVAIETGDADAAGNAITEALSLHIGRQMLDRGLVQRASDEVFGLSAGVMEEENSLQAVEVVESEPAS